MKIIYLADIHGDFDRVKRLLASTDAQVYIVAGDLIDRPFFSEAMAARYRNLQSSFSSLQGRWKDDSADLDDFIDTLLKHTDLAVDIREQAAAYRETTVRARRSMQQKYKILESILFLKGTSRILCLPGNYDMDLQYTSLHGRDLHRHWYHVAELRIAGYGGADVTTPGIPNRYAVPYNADRGSSEMTRFFAETCPDIIVTHKPAHGIHDHVSPMGESGSPELRRFCEENQVLLCLTGHIHDQWGFEEFEGTIFMNPSNFGAVPKPGGQVAEGGFFYDIDTRDRQIISVTLSKLVGDKVHDIVVHESTGGQWNKDIVDRERFGALLSGKNCDRREEDENRVPKSDIVQKMRLFFPELATAGATDALAEDVERIAARIEKQFGVAVAVDLLGEDRLTTSRASSVLEVVVYLRRDGDKTGGKHPEEGIGRPGCNDILLALQDAFSSLPRIRVADWIDLNRTAGAIQTHDYECDVAQRFAAYRALARPLCGSAADLVERQLQASPAYRSEIEGTGCAYMEIFRNLAGRAKDMKVFEARLRELGITAPPAFKKKIEAILYGRNETQDQECD